MIDEKFMESCIEEAPSVFLGRDVEVIARQPNLSGFRPDLICQSEENLIIVEIQQHALDRSHLYRYLEYRDLYPIADGSEKPIVILLCNEIEEKYINLVDTHKIELIVIPKAEFIDIASVHCPLTIANLLKKKNIFVNNKSIKGANSYEFKPIGWYNGIDISDAFQHLYQQIGCNKFDIGRIKNGYYWSILYQLERVVFCSTHYHRLESILDPTSWNIDRLTTKPTGWQPEILNGIKRIRKPRLQLSIFETSRGNLRVNWQPQTDGFGVPSRYNAGDWVEWSGEQPNGWSQPPNDLLFIKDIDRLNPGRIDYRLEEISCNWEVLDEIFIALIRLTYDHIFYRLSAIADVEKNT